MSKNMYSNAFKNKTVVITGHTGFKGSWLSIWLAHLGANVIGISENEISNPSNFSASKISRVIDDNRLDIRNADSVKTLVQDIKPDFIFHLAAQALVRPSYENPLQTMTTNAIGTANMLDAIRTLDKKVAAVMITSDKAYDNVEWVWGYRETDRLGGKDPYSASKSLAFRFEISVFFMSVFSLYKSACACGFGFLEFCCCCFQPWQTASSS